MNSAAILFYIIYLLLLDYITEISCCPSKSEFTGNSDHPLPPPATNKAIRKSENRNETQKRGTQLPDGQYITNFTCRQRGARKIHNTLIHNTLRSTLA